MLMWMMKSTFGRLNGVDEDASKDVQMSERYAFVCEEDGGNSCCSCGAGDEEEEQEHHQQRFSIIHRNYSSTGNSFACLAERKVRFQVVIWYVGPIDAVLGLVTMKFRVTIFWNAPSDEEHEAMATTGYGSYDASNKRVWTMQGRQRAYQRELHEILPGSNLVYVPPVSILNAVDFHVIGEPEVCCVEEERKAMKWTCMYKASLIQEHMEVKQFPHDAHDIVLKLGILKHRQPGRRWDRTKWKLGLATEEDSQGTIQVPHGLVVDHVKVPEVTFDREKDIEFQIVPLDYFGPNSSRRPSPSTTTSSFGTRNVKRSRFGRRTTTTHANTSSSSSSQQRLCRTGGISGGRKGSSYTNNNNNKKTNVMDECLQIKLHVRRDSGYYDKNIIPLLTMLNVVGISTLVLDPGEFGSRGEIILAIAFVAMGIRMTVDNKLPSVGYQIKVQHTLNGFFYTLLFLHLESALVYVLAKRFEGYWSWAQPPTIVLLNYATIVIAILYTAGLVVWYYYYEREGQHF